MSPHTPPEVSVVMPVGRVDKPLRSALAKLDQQATTARWELVIGLNTASVAERDQLDSLLLEHSFTARVVDASDKRGASYARNTAAFEAHGERLFFCDGDDEAEPDWIEELLRAHEAGTAIGGHLAEERLVVKGQENWRPPATPGELPSFMGAPYLVSANMAIWAKDFAAVGGFDESLANGEDIDFAWKLSEHGVDLRYCADAVIHYRHRAGLKLLVQQHYRYGVGMAHVLAQRQPPGADDAGASLMFKANGQSVAKQSPVQILRRGAIAAGRVRGLLSSR